MILIITHKEDFTADFLINKLNSQRISYYRFNCEDYQKNNIEIENGTKIKIGGHEDFSSIWFRRTKLPTFNSSSLESNIYLEIEFESLFDNLFSVLSCKWVSDPFSIRKAENKMYQLKLAKTLGLEIPETLVTSDKDSLLSFFKSNNENVIIKPLNQSRILKNGNTNHLLTNILKREHIERLVEYDLTPAIFQRKIEKDIEFRITVVGKDVFSAYTKSQEEEATRIDWRRGKQKFISASLPRKIQNQCIELVENMDLKFGAIDIVKDIQGNFIFLEINPVGQWAWIESDTGLKISESLISQLNAY